MKSEFLNTLQLEYDFRYSDLSPFWTAEEFKYYSELLGQVIYVPANMPTDFASVPHIFRSIIDNDENFVVEASVIHDFLYLSKKVDRKTADKVFKEAMFARNGTPWKVYLCYFAVRLCGWIYYKK